MQPFQSIIDVLIKQAKTKPNALAYRFIHQKNSESLTYDALLRRVQTIAGALNKSAKPDNQRVMLLLSPGLDYIASFYACLYNGCIAVPAYPPRSNHHLERLEKVISDASVSHIISDEALYQRYFKDNQNYANKQFVLVDTLSDQTLQEPTQIFAETIAFLQYTSGSTGLPKGVMVSHGNIIANLMAMQQVYRDENLKKMVAWLPPYHDMGLIGCILLPLFHGFPSVLMAPKLFLQQPLYWLKLISEEQATISFAPNFAFELCAKTADEAFIQSLDLSHWHLAINGSEPIQKNVLDHFIDTFKQASFSPLAMYPGYGLAEATLKVAGGKPLEGYKTCYVERTAFTNHQIKQVDSTHHQALALVASGRVIPHHELKIVDPQSYRCCEPFEIGEIWVSGVTVAKGYWQKPELSEQVFHAHIEGDQESAYLRTGDLGFIDSEGFVYVTGRIKDLLILHGRNFYPQDIEQVVEASHEAFLPHSCAAFSDQSVDSELIIIAEVHRHFRDYQLLYNSILSRLATLLDVVPKQIVLIRQSSLPKTSSGKIQRLNTHDKWAENSLKVIDSWVAAKPKKRSVEILQESGGRSVEQISEWLKTWLANQFELDKKPIDSHHVFAYYGLDSLSAQSLAMDVSEVFGVSLSPTLIWEYPQIEQFASMLFKLLNNQNESSKDTQNTIHPLAQTEPIAVIGMACRFPGAPSLEDFWQLLQSGRSGITDTPDPRWDCESLGMQIKRGGFLKDITRFDAALFSVSAPEAHMMDPQQRLLLELTWHAIEHAGITLEHLSGSNTGVFVGASTTDYGHYLMRDKQNLNAYYGTGSSLSALAGRLAYTFNLMGPAFTIDTACSSSLVALHQAINALNSHQCDIAIVAGVNLMLTPELTMSFSEANMLAPDGECKTFDEAANGYVRSEGCGVVILKRLVKAKQSGDNIHALIRGSAVNQDGHSNGFTAPNIKAQSVLLQQALAVANLEPDDIDYIEAHGTGTKLGDPIEFESIASIYGDRTKPLYLGSVKTNIGHCEAAAGIAGFIKAVLALKHQMLPAHLNYQRVNPLIDLARVHGVINSKTLGFDKNALAKVAVSSFGFTGTNAQVIIERATNTNTETKSLPAHENVVVLSANDKKALDVLVQKYKTYLNETQYQLATIAQSMQLNRTHLKHRLALLANDNQTAINALNQGNIIEKEVKIDSLSVAFLMTGQGSQYLNMGRVLYESSSLYQAFLDECFSHLDKALGCSLKELMFRDKDSSDVLNQTQYAQPAIFAFGYALAKWWESLGIKANYLLGHSIGEYTACVLANVMTLEQAAQLVVARARLMGSLPAGGAMAVIMASREELDTLLADMKVEIAATNALKQIVISGSEQSVDGFIHQCQQQNIQAKRLNVSHAFHSALMDPILEAFKKEAQKISFNTPTIPVVSNATGTFHTSTSINADYWVEHLRYTVRFSDCVATLEEHGVNTFIEIGAATQLSMPARLSVNEAEHYLWVGGLKQGYDDWRELLNHVATLYVHGASINWQALHSVRHAKADLPSYPFQGSDYWADSHHNPVADSVAQTNTLYHQQWQKTSLPEGAIQPGLYVVVSNQPSVVNLFEHQLKQCGGEILWLEPAQDFTKVSANHYLANFETGALGTELHALLTAAKGIIVTTRPIQDMDESIESLSDYQHTAYGVLLYLSQWLISEKISSPLWFIIQQSVVLDGDKIEKVPAPWNASLWGFGVTLINERYDETHLIDVNQLDEVCVHSLLKLMGSPSTPVLVCMRQSDSVTEYFQCHIVPKLKPVNHQPLTIKTTGCYLITGGAGGLGWLLCQWLANKGATHVVLVSRRLPGEQQRLHIEALEKQYSINITTRVCDVSNNKEVADLFEALSKMKLPLNGIFHLAGSIDDAPITQQSLASVDKVFSTKVLGTWLLYQQLDALAYKLDFWINFSSIASMIGNPGQSNYAAANNFLDQFSLWQQRRGSPCYSINFGPWAKVGMAVNLSSGFSQYGVSLLDAKAYFKHLEKIFASPQNAIIAEIDWSMLAKRLNPKLSHQLFHQLITDETVDEKSVLITRDISEQDVKATLKKLLKNSLAQDDLSCLTEDKNFCELGMDSLMIVAFQRKIQAIFALKRDDFSINGETTLANLTKVIEEKKDRVQQQKDVSHSDDKTPRLALSNYPKPSIKKFMQSMVFDWITTALCRKFDFKLMNAQRITHGFPRIYLINHVTNFDGMIARKVINTVTKREVIGLSGMNRYEKPFKELLLQVPRKQADFPLIIEKARTLINQQHDLVITPEGGRAFAEYQKPVACVNALHPFYDGFAILAAELNLTIVPIYLYGITQAYDFQKFSPGFRGIKVFFPPKKTEVLVNFGNPLDTTEAFNLYQQGQIKTAISMLVKQAEQVMTTLQTEVIFT